MLISFNLTCQSELGRKPILSGYIPQCGVYLIYDVAFLTVPVLVRGSGKACRHSGKHVSRIMHVMHNPGLALDLRNALNIALAIRACLQSSRYIDYAASRDRRVRV